MDRLILTDPAANFAQGRNFGRILLLSDMRAGLRGEYLLGRDAFTSAINSATGYPDAAVRGDPVYGVDGPFGMRCNQNDWLNLNLQEEAAMTIMVTVRNWNSGKNGKSVQICGTFYGDNAGSAFGLMRGADGALLMYTGSDGGALVSSAPGMAALDVAGWTTFAVRVGAGLDFAVKLDAMRGGARLQDTVSVPHPGKSRVAGASAALAIGSALGTSGANAFNGSIDVLCADIRAGALGDADLIALHRMHVATLASRGIAI